MDTNGATRAERMNDTTYFTLSELIDGYTQLHPEMSREQASKYILNIVSGAVQSKSVDNGNGTFTHTFEFVDPRVTRDVDDREAKPL